MKNSNLNRKIARFSFCIISFLFLFSCGTYTKNLQVLDNSEEIFTPYYLENFQEESFKISIEAFGNDFGGILVAKKLADQHYRFAMINEFGGKLMDFELIQNQLKLNYAIEQLDRKMLLNLLEKDFSMLFSESNVISETYQMGKGKLMKSSQNLYYFLENDTLKEIHFAKRKLKTKVILKNTKEAFPEVEIHHENLPIKIFIHLLSNQDT